MQGYIVELSNYFITTFMAMYIFTDLFACLCRKERTKSIIYKAQNLFMYLVQGYSFLTLTIVSKNIKYLFFYAFVQVFLLATTKLVPMLYKQCNKLLLNNMCMLLGIGLCIISRLSLNKAIRQYAIVLVALTISLLIPYLFSKIRFWKKLTWVYSIVGIALLSTVLILGEATYGSKISFSVAGITLQPSEFVKILFVFFLAGALWNDVSIKRVLLTTAIAGLHVIVLVLSRDLGSALIFFIAFVFILYIATGKFLYLLSGAIGGSGAAVIAYQLFDHVQTRVLAWKDPWSYIDDQGYQITQSLFAVGSGSWFGMGLLRGNPKAIPFVDADFIFSCICEEYGVIFSICLILICICCFLIMMRTAMKIHDRFYQIIVYGIGVMYIFQIFLTIGGGIKFIPLTGVTLPFISYGGSSVMVSLFMLFIVQGISIRLEKIHTNTNRTQGGES